MKSILVVATATRFGPRAAAAGVTLSTDIAEGAALTIAADRLAFDRMLRNLVENALAATGTGTGTGADKNTNATMVVVAVAPAGLPGGVDAIRFEVLDDGPGFPDRTAARAFERFWRGDPARAGAGSGLGLAIVKELALAHGGIAHAENRPEGGARVGVTLPRVPWPVPRPASNEATTPG